ncbi:hypothetical protein D3C87_1924240 [compost metagenome]
MVNKDKVAMDGREIGKKMVNRVRKCPAPSIMAASSSSLGMPRKKFIISTTLNTFTADGMTRAQMELVSPVFCTTR